MPDYKPFYNDSSIIMSSGIRHIITVGQDELNQAAGDLVALDSCGKGSVHCIDWDAYHMGPMQQMKRTLLMHCTRCGLPLYQPLEDTAN